MNIIFLDCDGVINGYSKIRYWIWKVLYIIGIRNKERVRLIDAYGVHLFKVLILVVMCKVTNSKLVISSSWRTFWTNDNRNVRELMRILNKYRVSVVGFTDQLNLSNHYEERKEEILKWVREHKGHIRNWYAIDDENLSDLGDHWINTKNRCSEGLKIRHLISFIWNFNYQS